MMDCTQAREEFAALLDGELNPDERLVVEAHLSQCSECLRELDGLKRVDVLFRGLTPQSAPADFEVRVREKLRPRVLRLGGRRDPRPLWPVLAVAATLLFVAGAIMIYTAQPPGFGMATRIQPEMASDVAERGVASAKLSAPSEELTGAPGAAMGMGAAAEPMGKPEMLSMSAQTEEAPQPVDSLDADPVAQDSLSEVAMPSERAIANNRGRVQAPAEKPASPPEPDAQFYALGAPPKAPSTEAAAVRPAPLDDAAGAPVPVLKRDAVARRAPSEDQTAAAAAPAPAPPEVRQFFNEPQVSKESDARQESADAVAGAPPAAESPAPMVSGEMAPAPAALAPAEVSAEVSASRPLAKEATPQTKSLGDRSFVFTNAAWVESTYDGQRPTKLVRGSREAQALLAAHADLDKVLALGDHVIFKAGRKWYEVSVETTP